MPLVRYFDLAGESRLARPAYGLAVGGGSAVPPLSQRQAAKALGVHHSTAQADLGGKSAKSGGKSATKAERRAERELELARWLEVPSQAATP